MQRREGGREGGACVYEQKGERGGERGLQLEIMQEPACPLAECMLTKLVAEEVL